MMDFNYIRAAYPTGLQIGKLSLLIFPNHNVSMIAVIHEKEVCVISPETLKAKYQSGEIKLTNFHHRDFEKLSSENWLLNFGFTKKEIEGDPVLSMPMAKFFKKFGKFKVEQKFL